jgi:AraC-like DNA-binding protein
MDRLAALLKHFSVSAQMFHSGPLCGINDFEPQKGLGQLHLLRKGVLQIEHRRGKSIIVKEPSLLFYPRPLFHRFITDKKTGAELTCAHIQFNHCSNNPLVQSLPEFLLLPLNELSDTETILDVLFKEAFHPRCGGSVVIDRLFEVAIVHILRWLMDHQKVPSGVLAGMAQPQIARSLVALHTHPEKPWSLESLADQAGMSRSVYAAQFKKILDTTPGEYLAQWRFGLAQQKLMAGTSLKQIAQEVGYGSVEAFSRAFKAHCQLSPREWKLQSQNTP